MLIGIPAEIMAGETRVAITPETAKKLKAQGHTLRVQSGAGVAASVPDAAYAAVGAEITDAAGAYAADIVLKVRCPLDSEMAQTRPGSVMVGMLNPFDAAGLQRLARVVILGVGVAGLQAIATAKRLGAVIEASDVRPSVKEQVESLGGKFIDVPYETDEEREAAVGVGGYAKPMPASWMARQKIEVAKRVAQADVVITTALIRAGTGDRRNGHGHEAGQRDRRPGCCARRQLPADRGGQDRGQARRDADRRDQRRFAGGGRCQRAVCTQSARLPQAHHHQRWCAQY